MITISLFALLATSLALLVWVAQLLKNNKAQEELINTLLERVEVQEHSLECYKILHETELTRADNLEQEILNNKESSYFLLESYQEELDTAQECIWAKEKKIGQLQAQANKAQVDLQILVAKLDKEEITPNELAFELSWISATLTQDEIPF